MAEIETDLERLDVMLSELEGTIQGTQAVTATFRDEMADVQNSMRSASQDASGLSRSVGTSLKNAFQGLIFDGARLSDVFAGLGRSMAGSVLSAALKPVQNALGGLVTGAVNTLFGGAAFAKGGVMSSGRVQAFAKGGVVGGPTHFPMRRGMGLMGEAGPEAIMPLARGADGALGVRAAGGGKSINVTMNISTPDTAGFQRSQSQIAAQMNRIMSRAGRNL